MPVQLLPLPHGGHELLVNGSPFLPRAAELHNSSLSSPAYMREVWPKLVAQNINTALGAVGWEDIEPEEGTFVFTDLDEVIKDAREAGVKLVLLWFGSHKNGHMSYAPEWVKTNPTRFPRAMTKLSPGAALKTNDYLSVFSTNTMDADAKAFAVLMAHLKEIDEAHGTVLMVQVENEPGVLGDTRDRNPEADRIFDLPVPSTIIDTLSKEKDTLNAHLLGNFECLKSHLSPGWSWEDTFGAGIYTDELFMAYHFAVFINHVAEAGKKAYHLPMYTNAALRHTSRAIMDGVSGGSAPGIYPSGGPVETVIDIYELFAPSLDFVSPDIYFADYEGMCQEYTHRGRPLFIPEQRRDEPGALRTWVAIGGYCGLGTAPFGIDTLDVEESVWTRHYGLLRTVEQHVLAARREGKRMIGFFFDAYEKGTKDPVPPKTFTIGGWQLFVERQPVHGHGAPAYGLIIQTGPDSFLLIGEGYQITFKSTNAQSKLTGLVYFHEKEVVDEKTGEMRTLRRLNGDETHCGKQVVMPCQDPDYGWYPIATNIPSRTKVAECKVYSF